MYTLMGMRDYQRILESLVPTWAKFNRLQFRTVIVYLVGGRQRTRRVTALTTYTLKNHEEVYMYT